MHEFSILQNIFPVLEKIAKENNLKSIRKVTLKVGKLRQIVPETLQAAFKTLSESTIASGAELIIIEIPVKILCSSCKKQSSVEDNIYICPNCGSVNIEVLSGKEIVLDNIEGERR